MSTLLDDTTLVLMGQLGDERALATLLQRYRSRLMIHAQRILARPDLAADAVQEGFIKIARELPNLSDPSCFRAWAYRIVTNQALDALRKEKRHSNLPVVDQQETVESPIDLDAAWIRLPRADRMLLALRYRDEMTIQEIGLSLGIATGTVKSRLFAARKRLRILLEGENHV